MSRGPLPALAIEAHHLTKSFGAFTAVDDVDLEVREGELFGLLGPNGAGKTTVVRMLTGLVKLTSGTARIAGIDVAHDPDGVRSVLGVVSQALTSDLDLTGYENMDIHARYFGVERTRRKARIEELMSRVGLWERRKDLVKTYSGGMRRRLEIARGLVHTPKVLFLDEPTIGLDPQSRRIIWDILRDLRRDSDLTISLTTHYLDEADALCDRVAIVDHGKIIALGAPSDLKSKVPGSDTIELVLAHPISDETLAEIRGMSNVRDLKQVGTALSLRVDGGAALLPPLLELLRRREITATSASVSRVTLEDAFIYFTGRSLREEPAHVPAPPRRL